jgi:SNF2 family DNA or RNA helicase
MHRLGAVANYKMLLTGTPVTNKPLDVFSQYKFTDVGVFGPNFYAFRNRYFDMVGFGGYEPVLKKSCEDEFTRRIHSIAFRATKAECLDLPETIDVMHHVDLEPSAAKIYRNLAKDSWTELQSLASGDRPTITATNVLTRLLRLSQCAGGFVTDDEGGVRRVSTAKLEALEELIEAKADAGEKTVVIARFTPEIDAICRMLNHRGVTFSLVQGSTTDRDEQVRAFQTDPSVMVFVGQIATAGLGITLTAASTLVFFCLDYSMANFEQAKARIHRVGQTRACTYIYLTARGTVDEKVLAALRDKSDIAKALIDDCRAGKNPFE